MFCGRVVQGGADATREFYRRVRTPPSGDTAADGCPAGDAGSGGLTIVNVARRKGEAKLEELPGGRIMWLPMVEGDRSVCDEYLERHSSDLLATLHAGGTVVVNCQEGLHRSVMFTQLLLLRAGAAETSGPEPEPEFEPSTMTVSSPVRTLELTDQPRPGGFGLAALKLPELAETVVDSIEALELAELLAEGTATVVDVRSAEERADGFVAGSVHVPSELWDRWHTTPGQSPVRQELQCDAKELLAAAVAENNLVVFYCMYSKERAPRAAQAAAEVEPSATIAVLRGGFQRLMAQLWHDANHVEGEERSRNGGKSVGPLFESVRCDHWVPNGRQGLVWKPDLDSLHLSHDHEPVA